MILGALVSVLFFAPRAYSSSPSIYLQAHAEKTLTDIANTFKLDPGNLPFLDSEKTERRCLATGGPSCFNSYYFTRQTMIDGTAKATAYPVKHIEEGGGPNTDPKSPSKQALQKSVAETEARTQGWSAGGTVTLGEGNKVGSVGLTASYTDQITKSTTKETSVTNTHDCPPLNKCHFETWTYHMKVVGTCSSPKPMYDCGGTKERCTPDDEDPCPERCPSHSLVCTTPKDSTCDVYKSNAGATATCEFTTPILLDDGRPYSEVIFVITPL